MQIIDHRATVACQDALRRIRALRSEIASELAGAAVNAGDDTELAGEIEYLEGWLSDGAGPMQNALEAAGHAVSAAADDEYERRVVVTA